MGQCSCFTDQQIGDPTAKRSRGAAKSTRTLQEQGIGVAAISYDSVEVVADFAQRRGITFPLLADSDSSVISDSAFLIQSRLRESEIMRTILA